MSLPSCPVAPMIATGLEDDIALDDGLKGRVPLHQALVPFDGAGSGSVGQRAVAEGGKDLAGANLRRFTGRVPETMGDLLETHLVRPMIGIAVPVLHVWQVERLAAPLRERLNLEILIVGPDVEDL